jgi:hypothetical protein
MAAVLRADRQRACPTNGQNHRNSYQKYVEFPHRRYLLSVCLFSASHGRSVVKKVLAAPAPRAAANPKGRQQLIVATELRIATNEAETPVPCFTVCGLGALLVLPDELSPLAEDRFASIQDTNGNSAQNFVPAVILQQHLVH